MSSPQSEEERTYRQQAQRAAMPDAAMSEKECEKIGGHCWEQQPWILTTNPPQYERRCKHCGKVQWGQPHPSIEWRNRDA